MPIKLAETGTASGVDRATLPASGMTNKRGHRQKAREPPAWRRKEHADEGKKCLGPGNGWDQL